MTRAGVAAPFAVVSLILNGETTLPHDNHPSRFGHRRLQDQYLRLLHQLGWIPVPEAILPPMPRDSRAWLNPDPDAGSYVSLRRESVRSLPEVIDFTALRSGQSRAFLGGLFPDAPGSPWASVRAAFVLRRPRGRPLRGVDVEIEIPARVELFPFALRLLLDGTEAASLHVERPTADSRYRDSGAPAGPAFSDDVVEVTLETASYFSTIDDSRMKSYRPLRARAY
jgi:hypothetical protein